MLLKKIENTQTSIIQSYVHTYIHTHTRDKEDNGKNGYNTKITFIYYIILGKKNIHFYDYREKRQGEKGLCNKRREGGGGYEWTRRKERGCTVISGLGRWKRRGGRG